jgi:hypothetical protein
VCPAASSKTVSFKLQPAPEINPGTIPFISISHRSFCFSNSYACSGLFSSYGRTCRMACKWSCIVRME